MTKDEVLKMAHHALELANYYVADYCNGNTIEEIDDAITAIKEALAQPEQEPVAWAENDGDGNVLWNRDSCFSDDPEWLDNPMPLYTTPPQRQWVGLTDQDKQTAFDETQEGGGFWEFADAIEAKLKEKNYQKGETD